MMRNYLMPGFALVLLAVFASPRPTPPLNVDLGASEASPNPAQQVPRPLPAAQSKQPQLEGSEQLFSPNSVCAVATREMHEKLGEFGLNPELASSGEQPAAEAMIALVPDPVHTHLALLFDRYIDIIQQALQDSTSEKAPGWIYASQWLPWDQVPYQASQDPVVRTNIHTFDAERECAPGFLIFRRNRFQGSTVGDKFLVLFLVGESPTSGILHQDQFINAVRGWRQVEQRDTDLPGKTLRILGPAFSASLTTLDSLLLAKKCGVMDADPSLCFDRAQVVSASVSASRKILRDSGNFPGLRDANFISMNESAETIQQMLLNYLSTKEHIPADKVAFVSEDETPFGNLLSSTVAQASVSTGPGNWQERSLLFHYPREISQLRNAYEKNSIFTRQSSSQAKTTDQTQADLKLSLEDRHEEEDSVPSFSDTQSPISEESVLSAITRAIDRQHVRVAVINGTDVLDVIFVARYFSRNLPDVRVILLNADLLFQRSPDVSDFRGMLMANTYPLIPDNIQWSGRFLHVPPSAGQKENEERDHPSPFGTYLPDRIFSSHETPGLYNAVRLLEMVPLQIKSDAVVPTRNGSRDYLWLPEYTDPFHGGNHPPLWLNAIGRGGFWPIALLDHYPSPAVANQPSAWPTSLPSILAGNTHEVSRDGSIPPGMFDTWYFQPFDFGPITLYRPVALQLVVARLMLTCLLALFILFGLILCVFARLDRHPEYVFDIPGTNGERRGWLVLVIILCYSWIARLLILDLPASRFFRDPINCGLIFLQAILLLFAFWIIRRALAKGERPRFAWLLVLLAALAEYAFKWMQPADFAARIFYLYRSQYLFNGVCPVLPFIFLFVAIICLISRHIRSLFVFSPLIKPRVPCHQNENSPPILRFISSDNVKDMLLACYSPWRMLYSKRAQLKSRSQGEPDANSSTLLSVLFVLTLLMLFLSSYLLFPRGFETFETRAYSICLSAFTLGIDLILLHEIGWVVLMWVCLHKGLLTPLERTTLRACFSRVSGFSWQRLWFSIDLSPASRFKPISRAYESMLRIQKDRFCPEHVERDIQEASAKYNAIFATPEPDKRVIAFSDYQDSLCKCATSVIRDILSDSSRQKEPLATSLDVPAKEIEEVLKTSAEADSLAANAEEFIGLVYIYAIQHVLMDIRSHILAFTFGYFFLLLALNAYPVAPHHSIMVMLILIFTGFVIAVVVTFSQMHRDSILSRTTSTEPGKLDFAFYEKLLSVLSVPVIGLLASQFPEISNFLFSWLEPSLQTLK